MANVRAKFRVQHVVLSTDGSADRVVLCPVYDGSPENKEFFRSTPTGVIDFMCLNRVASEQFTAGAEFFVDFTKA